MEEGPHPRTSCLRTQSHSKLERTSWLLAAQRGTGLGTQALTRKLQRFSLENALGQWAQEVFFFCDEPTSGDLELAEDELCIEFRFQSGEVRLVPETEYEKTKSNLAVRG
eukprot:INCI13203.1.p2 GENE.INCI13203.1~~INCI13203.1.p2  ORF type:complete len:110 (-),score=15.39 INCI13203.1:477-806(-)